MLESPAPFAIAELGADREKEILIEVLAFSPEEVLDGDFIEFAPFVFAERHGFELDRLFEGFEDLFGGGVGLGEVFEDFDVDDDVAHGAVRAFGGDVEVLAEFFKGVDGAFSVEAREPEGVDEALLFDVCGDLMALGFGGDEGDVETDAVADENVAVDEFKDVGKHLSDFRFALEHFSGDIVNILGNLRNVAFGIDKRFDALFHMVEGKASGGYLNDSVFVGL